MSVSKTADGSLNRLITYIKEAYNELMNKVTWPTWPELQSSAWVVMVAALIIAVIVYVMDAGSGSLMKLFYSI